ncbi:MAG: hypothetical protein KDE27_09315 [Planctomycetes bacterium]|nr:hypothetical protein [Planctomycetota bacterium]
MLKATILSALAAVTCAAGSAALPTFLAGPTGGHADPRDIVAKAEIPLSAALARALAACPGHAVEAELEGEIEDAGVDVFYEVMIVGNDGRLHEVKLDPRTGAVRSNVAAAAGAEAGELAGFQAVLAKSGVGLGEVLERFAGIVNGFAVKAALELEDGQPRCEVATVHGRYLIGASFDAAAGRLVELELAAGPKAAAKTAGEDEEDEEGEAEEREEAEENEAEEREGAEEHEENERGERTGQRKGRRGGDR